MKELKEEVEEGTDTELENVREMITDKFDEETWQATEAALSTHATLLIDSKECLGLVFVGPSGAGKTTVLRFFEGLEDQIYRSDEVTPAAFVSQSADKTEEELAEVDLLPKLKDKTLLCRDLARWFAGGKTAIYGRMSTLANVMDGEGYRRDAGTHGSRGYDGDYAFNLLGATTPLQGRAWKAMGHAGNRLLFYEINGSESVEAASESVFSPVSYDDQIAECRDAIHELLEQIWAENEGKKGVEWSTRPPRRVVERLERLAKIIKYGRAKLDGDSGPQRESPERIMTTLRDLARGRSLFHEGNKVQDDDLQPCATVALSTMPKERRPIIRLLLDPDRDGELTAGEIASKTSISRPTALDRMELVAKLGFGSFAERDDGRDTKVLRLNEDLSWPEGLTFPE